MSKIRILDVRYDPLTRSVDYHASLRTYGSSISISARAAAPVGCAVPPSLHELAQRHAAEILKAPSASGYRIEA